MSQNFNRPASPMQPMSVGNVVSTGVTLYRSHLKMYLGLAAKAYLWVLVPVYGWAKYAAISAAISRHAFAELAGKPESINTATNQTNAKKWSFLALGITLFFYVFALYIGMVIVAGILAGILGAILAAVFGQAAPVLLIVLTAIIFLGVILGITWFYAHWMIAEVPLAIEDGMEAGTSLQRSWNLSKNSAVRIQGIVIIATLVSLPLVLVTGYLPQLFLIGLNPQTSTYWIVYFISLILSLVGGALIVPFWQAIKAVIYYDLRSRREGLGLELNDRNI